MWILITQLQKNVSTNQYLLYTHTIHDACCPCYFLLSFFIFEFANVILLIKHNKMNKQTVENNNQHRRNFGNLT